MTEELREALDKLKGLEMPEGEFQAQRVSFVYGNSERSDKGTKEDVRRSLTRADYATA